MLIGKRVLSLVIALLIFLTIVPALPVESARQEGAEVFEILPPKYDSVGWFREGFARVGIAGAEGQDGDGGIKYGFVDMFGREITPIMYDLVLDFSEGMALVNVGGRSDLDIYNPITRGGKSGFIDTTGREVVPVVYDFASSFSEGFASVVNDGKWGFVNMEGDVAVALKYDHAMSFSEGMAAVSIDGKWGFIDTQGNEVVPAIYDSVTDFSDGIATVSIGGRWVDDEWRIGGQRYIGGRWGVIDKTGSEIVHPQYDSISQYLGAGMMAVSSGGELGEWGYDGGKRGIISTTGREIAPVIYDSVRIFSEYHLRYSEFDIAWVEYEKKWGLVDATGSVLIQPKYDRISSFFSGDIRWVNANDRFGAVDKNGREIIPPIYDSVRDFGEGLIAVSDGGEPLGTENVGYIGGRWGFTDANGRIIAPLVYEDVGQLGSRGLIEGMVSVRAGGRWGFIDSSGREIVSPIYDSVNNFSEGMAAVSTDGEELRYGSYRGSRWGFIDKTGSVIVPPRYDSVGAFSEGLAAVSVGGEVLLYGGYSGSRWGFIDKTGREIVPPRYDSAGAFSEGMAAVRVGDKLGFIDATGREIVPPKYDAVGSFSDGIAEVVVGGNLEFGGKRGFIDTTGREIVTPMYDYVSRRNNGMVDVGIGGQLGFDEGPYYYGGKYGLISVNRLHSYRYQQATMTAEQLLAVDAALDGRQDGGDETLFFRLAGDVYYAVAIEDGWGIGGAVIREGRRDGGIVYHVEHVSETLLSVDELAGFISRAASAPNVEIDFGAVSLFTHTGEFAEYLRGALDNMDGSAPNDAALRGIASYMQEAAGRASLITINTTGNEITISERDITRAAATALDINEGLEGLLDAFDIALLRQLAVTIRIAGLGLDFGEMLRVTLDASVAELLGDSGITILLGDIRHAITVTGVNLRAITREHGSISMQIDRRGSGVYSITFSDERGSFLGGLPAPVTVTLPADGPYDTVFADFGGRVDNWGGRHDEAARTLLFSTPFSGTYEVRGNLQDMADISDLPEEMQLAVRYMVSKGFFQPAGGLFDPRGAVSRYEFAETLVRMSFALDRNLTTSFEDVPRDSVYYPFIASGEHEGLIGGVGGNRFAGEDNMARQQAVALASRALHNRGGFMYPEDAEAYLLHYGDAQDIAGWARNDVSLAAREGIIGMGGNFAPGRDITRAEAAIILYRLFAVLYETPPVAASIAEMSDAPADDDTAVGEDNPLNGAGGESRAETGETGLPEPESGSFPLVLVIIAAAIALGGAAAYFLYFKKRRKPESPAGAGGYSPSESPEPPLYPMKNSTPGTQPYTMDSGVPGTHLYPTDSGTPEAPPHNSEIPAGIVCGNCGTALAETARFCNKCGAAVTGNG